MIICYCCRNAGAPAMRRAVEEGLDTSSILVIDVPCTGMIEKAEVLRRLREGADRVLLMGCLLENCTHVYGNEMAKRRIDAIKGSLRQMGIDEGRVDMIFLAPHRSDLVRMAIGEEQDTIVREKVEEMDP